MYIKQATGQAPDQACKAQGKPDVRNYKVRGRGRTQNRETSLIASLM